MSIRELSLTKEQFIDYLNECFLYRPDTGEFTWKERPRAHFKREGDWAGFNKVRSGMPAGCLSNNGYLGVGLLGKRMQVHRLAWMMFYGEIPECIDHINGNRLDQRIANLRNVSVAENNRNRASVKNKKDGRTGVYWCPLHKKYRARIKSNGVDIHVGYFDDPDEARTERKKAEIKLGFHSNHGRSQEDAHA